MPFQNLSQWIDKYPALKPVIHTVPTTWLNPSLKKMSSHPSLPLRKEDVIQAASFMEKYAPYLASIFASTAAAGGHIISPLREIDHFREHRNAGFQANIRGRFFLKCDSELPVAGSIKARGGFYEVLNFAHKLAVKEGLISNEGAGDFTLPAFTSLFSRYTIGVGSTGNLGLSIGIISAGLGFHVKVYMSRDAREWKKQLLKKHGADVIEVAGDFGAAVRRGREETLSNPFGYFVDDENSSQLFLGYSLGGMELVHQLQELNIRVDEEHPLFVYSPCGVGGSPGGVMFGLKMFLGDAVHSFFVEPTHAPSVLIGLITGKKDKVTVQDFGLDNRTEADGLAVGRSSIFATGIIKKLVSGIYTLADDALFRLVEQLFETEKIFVEPSAAAGLVGPEKMHATEYISQRHIDPAKITHVAWATGGSLVPEDIRKDYLTRELSNP